MKHMKTKQILQSLMLIFLLIGIIFPISAYTYQEETPDGILIIDVQPDKFNLLEDIFGIITTIPTVVKPGQTITINAGLEVPRSFNLASSYLYVSIPGFFEKRLSPLPCSSYQTCQVKVTYTLPSTIRAGIYTVSFSAADNAGIIDRASQTFSV